MSGRTPRWNPNRRTWAIAWFLTLALHAIAMIGVQVGRAWVPSPPPDTRLEPVQLTFVERPAAKVEPKGPTHFTELPADRQDQPPEHADFLSNVTSRARDHVPGGNESMPRLSGEADAPAVALESGKVEPKPANMASGQQAPQPPAAAGTNTPTESPGAAGERATAPPAPDVRPSPQSFPKESTEPGSSDTRQPEMDNPDGNARLTGDVSLSTTAWEWSPWLQRFGRRLMSIWMAPPAYYMGLIKDGGWTVVEMEIARSGEVLRMDVLEEQGHESLIRAATGALRSCSPTEPLPADFPDKTLILRVRLIYPKFRRR